MLLVVLSRTLELARARFATLFAAGWGYMLVLVALNLAISAQLMPDSGFTTGSYMMEPLAAAGDAAARERALRLLAVLANVAAGFSIGVAFLRRVLLGERAFPLAFGLRNIRVAWKLALLGLLSVLFFVPLLLLGALLTPVTGPVGGLLLLASPFVTLMLVQRVSLVLPAAALDDSMSLKDSWRLTAGIGWSLAFAALVVSLLAALATGLWVGLVSLVGDAFVPATGLAAQLRSALVPMGAMVILTWLFASLHATAYALTRERFVEKVGLRMADAALAAERRAEADRHLARQAVRSVLGARQRRD
jgi:hypothetical protein